MRTRIVLKDKSASYHRVSGTFAVSSFSGANASSHIPGKTLAKTVVVKVDDKLLMEVIPATDMVDFKSLRKAVSAATAHLAGEDEFRSRFPECEVGAMPPFGNLYDMAYCWR